MIISLEHIIPSIEEKAQSVISIGFSKNMLVVCKLKEQLVNDLNIEQNHFADINAVYSYVLHMYIHFCKFINIVISPLGTDYYLSINSTFKTPFYLSTHPAVGLKTRHGCMQVEGFCQVFLTQMLPKQGVLFLTFATYFYATQATKQDIRWWNEQSNILGGGSINCNQFCKINRHKPFLWKVAMCHLYSEYFICLCVEKNLPLCTVFQCLYSM